MTHTLHRRGSAESLSRDFPVMILRAMGFNQEGYLPKCKEFLRIAARHNPVNMASEMKGNILEFPLEEIIEQAEGDSFAVFDNPKDLTEFLAELREADLGLSVVVSGDFETVQRCFREAGLQHHTANFSLGTWGKEELLPDENVLEMVTMCGHGMVTAPLVKAMVNEIKGGRMTSESAAKLLGGNCKCGIFNTKRAVELLQGF